MPGVMRLRPAHVRAMNAGGGTCAPCQGTGWRPTAAAPRAPARTVLRFHEYRDYDAVTDVHTMGHPLTPARMRPVDGRNIVYVFKRQGGRVTVAATLPGGGTYTLPTGAAGAGAEYYVCLSHFPLPPERLRQFRDPAHFAALQRRCHRFNVGDRYHVRAAGGGAYDVAVIDWRGIGDELHRREQEVLEAVHGYAADPKVAQRRMLAELTLSTAVHYQKHDDDVWDWLRPAARVTGWQGARPTGLGPTTKYTACERELAEYAKHMAELEANAEEVAEAKYSWMTFDGYREMRWDSLTAPEEQKRTVAAEGRMIAPTPQTPSGQAYARYYTTDPDGWYGRFMLRPRPDEVDAFRNDPTVADAYWAMFAVVSAAMLSGSNEGADRSGQRLDVVKNTAGGGDAGAKIAAKPSEARVATTVSNRRASTAGVGRAQQSLVTRRAIAARAQHIARSPAWVMQEFLVPSLLRFPGASPPFVVYDPATGSLRSVRSVRVATPTTRGAADPQVAAAARRTAASAQAAERQLADAMAAEGRAQTRYFDALAFERQHAGAAWMTSGAVAAIGVVNLCSALKALREEDNALARLKLAGAVADLLYSTEYGVLRSIEAVSRPAASEAQAAAAAGGRARLLLGVRWLGIIGGVISMVSAGADFQKALTRQNPELAVGAGLAFVGAAMITMSIAAAMAGTGAATSGTVIGGLLAAAGGTSWTVIGAVLALTAAGIVYLFAETPVEAWLKSSPWGIDPDGGKSDQQQLRGLLQLLCTPQLTARAYGPGHPGLPPGVRGPGVRATLQPPLFLPGDSTMEFELQVQERMYSGRSESPVATRFRVGGMQRPLRVGPIAREAFARLATHPLVLRATESNTVVVVRLAGDRVAFDCYLPVRRALSSRREGFLDVSTRWFECDGTAHLAPWAYHASSAWRGLTLERMDLAVASVSGTG